jgi:hypothetical protein
VLRKKAASDARQVLMVLIHMLMHFFNSDHVGKGAGIRLCQHLAGTIGFLS